MSHFSLFIFCIIFLKSLLAQECSDYSSELSLLKDRVEQLEGWEQYCITCSELVSDVSDTCLSTTTTACPEITTTACPEVVCPTPAPIAAPDEAEAWKNAVENGGLRCTFVPELYRSHACAAPTTSPTVPSPCVDTLSTTDCERVKDLGLCEAMAQSASPGCDLTCGTCCETLELTNCLDE